MTNSADLHQTAFWTFFIPYACCGHNENVYIGFDVDKIILTEIRLFSKKKKRPLSGTNTIKSQKPKRKEAYIQIDKRVQELYAQ